MQVHITEFKCPSGAVLKIRPAPFADAKNLYQALLSELRDVSISTKMEMGELYKQLFCVGFSSPLIEEYLWKCLEKCTYNNGKGDLKIDKDTFEPLEARDDYMSICMEVTKENVSPFAKSLYAQYKHFVGMTDKSPA